MGELSIVKFVWSWVSEAINCLIVTGLKLSFLMSCTDELAEWPHTDR